MTPLVAPFLLNEVFPRAKKIGVSPQDFLDPKVVAFLLDLEASGALFRGQTRRILDNHMKELKNG